MNRNDWARKVYDAEIGATPVKVQRTLSSGAVQTFWELALEVNGQPIDSTGEFRFVYTTRKAALAGLAESVRDFRAMVATVEYYFEAIDAPDQDFVKAVLGS